MTENLVYSTQTQKDPHLATNLFVRIIAEFCGTALLAFMIYCLSSWVSIFSSGGYMLVIGLGVTAAVAAVSYLFGNISGAHVNPAVTFAAMLSGYTKIIDGIAYIVAQVLGAFAAAGLWLVVIPRSEALPMTTWLGILVNGYDANSPASTLLQSSTGSSTLQFGIQQSLILEIVFTLAIVGAFMATMNENGTVKKNHTAAYATTYGLAAGISFLVDGSGFNPARSTGIAIIGAIENMKTNPLTQLWVYWIAPLVAAAVVAFIMIVKNSVAAYNEQKLADAHELTLNDAAENDNLTDSDEVSDDESLPQTSIIIENNEEEESSQE